MVAEAFHIRGNSRHAVGVDPMHVAPHETAGDGLRVGRREVAAQKDLAREAVQLCGVKSPGGCAILGQTESSLILRRDGLLPVTGQSIPPLLRPHKRPAQPLPADAADCHCHVFGPYDRFPLAATRSYSVPDAPLAAHEAMKRDVGLARTVFVQASGYDTDNRCLVAALRALGPQGRGIAVVDPDAPESLFDELHAAGVRGLRANFATLKGRYGDPATLIDALAKRVKPRGWHLQVFAESELIATLEPVLARARIDLVIDHLGLPEARAGLGQPGFQAVLRLLRTGHVWAKLSGADRISRATGRLADAVPYMQAAVDANIDRLVWGTDWPHIGFHPGTPIDNDHVLPYRPLDAGDLLDVLSTAVPDAAHRAKILAANPARLYFS